MRGTPKTTQRATLREGLRSLGERLRRDLALLNYPPDNWVEPRCGEDGSKLVDVLIVGGGMCGLTAAFALLRRGIGSVRVVDRSAPGREGPWVTYARMQTLRSPKHLTGPAMGLPSLTFRAWYEAQWGEAAWERLGRIPRPVWMDYLCWYREVLGLPVENGVSVVRVEPSDSGFLVGIERGGEAGALRARKVVLATGREGMAVARVPEVLAPFRDEFCLHSSEAIDFASLRGRDVAVVGIGASALDNAGEALEAGAASVAVLARAPAIPRINKAKGTAYDGFTHGFPLLPPAMRLQMLEYIFGCRIAPPRESLLRVARHANAEILTDAPVTAARSEGGRLRLCTPQGERVVDKVILGTGFRIDLAAAPELRALAPAIASWRDRADPGPAHARSEFVDFPSLGSGFEFREKRPGEAPWLADLHCFTFAATLSHGNVSGDIPAVSDGAERLARQIAGDLFTADAQAHWRRLQNYTEPELLGDETAGEHAWWPALD